MLPAALKNFEKLNSQFKGTGRAKWQYTVDVGIETYLKQIKVPTQPSKAYSSIRKKIKRQRQYNHAAKKNEKDRIRKEAYRVVFAFLNFGTKM